MPERSLWYYITAAGAAIGAVIYWAQDIAVAFDKIDQVVRKHFLPPNLLQFVMPTSFCAT